MQHLDASLTFHSLSTTPPFPSHRSAISPNTHDKTPPFRALLPQPWIASPTSQLAFLLLSPQLQSLLHFQVIHAGPGCFPMVRSERCSVAHIMCVRCNMASPYALLYLLLFNTYLLCLFRQTSAHVAWNSSLWSFSLAVYLERLFSFLSSITLQLHLLQEDYLNFLSYWVLNTILIASLLLLCLRNKSPLGILLWPQWHLGPCHSTMIVQHTFVVSWTQKKGKW